MKTEIKFLLVIFILLFFFIAGAEEKQKTEWKGTIKYENGVKVIKNPEEPLFGEIEFDIEQDLNLGKEDDNNYLFYQVRGIVLDKSDYQIFVIDNDGNLRSSIQKKENFHSISQKEKKRIIEKIGESISRGGTEWPEGVLEKACSFPSMRPFFSRIIVDDMQRLYLWRVKSVLDKSEKQEFDVFSKEGRIHRITIPG